MTYVSFRRPVINVTRYRVVCTLNKNSIRIFCHFLVAKSDQKASLAKAKTHCNRLFENFLHEINSRNQRSDSISKTA